MRIEEKFSKQNKGYMVGKVLDGTECQILLDTGASKSFMSKSPIYVVNHSTHYQSLHQNTENLSREWTVCERTFHNPNNNRYTWP